MAEPSGDESLGVYLPDYLREIGKDITEDDLEKLAVDFVKTNLSNGSQKLLNVVEIGKPRGVTRKNEEERVRYVTTRAAVVNNNRQVTLVANKPPASSIKFQLPQNGPPVVPASSLNAISKPHGFKLLNEPALVTPVWEKIEGQDFGMMYKYTRGVPAVDFLPLDQLKKSETAPFSWQLPQYCEFKPESPDEIGVERFIFTGRSKDPKLKHSIEGYYMRLEDLKRRVETDNAKVAWDDVKLLNNEQHLYSLWDTKGTLVDPNLKGLFTGPDFKVGIDHIAQAKQLFFTHCKIVRLARLNPGLYDVLSRFWDEAWEPKAYVQINPKYQEKVRKSAAARLKLAYKPEDGDKHLMTLIKEVQSKWQFKPTITIEWKEGNIELPEGQSGELRLWATHPNSLYAFWIHCPNVNTFEKHGLWLAERKWPTLDEMKPVDNEIQQGLKKMSKKYTTAKDAVKTVTEVTKTSMDAVRNFKRNPDQIRAMGGMRPNILVEGWWKTPVKEKPAEWLHRSAWSYGGLHDDQNPGKVDPQSSQVMSNLIIGTHEANTMMIRHEIFVKRLAQYGKDKNNKDVMVTVGTVIRDKYPTVKLPTYAWCCTDLKYYVLTPKDSIPDVDYTTNFDPFSRQLPTRLEVDLDELFELLIYGWGDSDFMAPYVEDTEEEPKE